MRPVWINACATMTKDSLTLPERFTRELRRADLFICLAVSAAEAAFSPLYEATIDRSRIGLFVGNAFGPIETGFRFLDSILDAGEKQASPTLFSHSVHNIAAGYVSRLLDIRGPVQSMTTFSWPFLSALQQARFAVAFGVVDAALVLTVEVRCPLLDDACIRWTGRPQEEGVYGAVAWLVQAQRGSPAPFSRAIREIQIEERPCEPEAILLRKAETFAIDRERPQAMRPPLGYAFALSKALAEKCPGATPRSFSLQALFGRARLHLGENGEVGQPAP